MKKYKRNVDPRRISIVLVKLWYKIVIIDQENHREKHGIEWLKG